MNSSGLLRNLKSRYILQKLFNNLLRKKLLDIIKYNKNLKQRINININDYKEYFEIYSSIEIEIKPDNNLYGVFINIDEGNEIYYHIYFNSDKEEINRNYLIENETIKTIKIIIDYHVISFEELFLNCESVEYICFKKFYRNNINNMHGMFCGCSSLKELNLSNFKTNNVTDMSYMFFGCSSLKELNLSNFNTNNLSDMYNMFYGCSSLKELNLSNFNNNNVTDMKGIFCECSSLQEIDLSNFNTNNVIDMRGMFFGCTSLKELNFLNFNINNVIYIESMFYGCSEEFQKKIKVQYKNIKKIAFENYYLF